MARTHHTSTTRGKRVKVTLRNGTVIYGKFHEKSSKHVFLDCGEDKLRKISTEDMSSMALIKGGFPISQAGA